MNFDGYTEAPITRFSSLVEQDSPDNLPLGVSPNAHNCRYHLTSVRTRDGLQNQFGFKLADGTQPVTGLASLKLGGNPDSYVPMAFDYGGDLVVEVPVGTGKTVAITSTQLSLPQNSFMQAATAFKKGYLAFGDLKNSLGAPAVYDIATQTLDPLSMRPAGESWKALTLYAVGEVVTPATPVGGNSHSYRCTVAGKSAAAQPAFPTTEGGTVVDGTVTWTETTPVMAQYVPVPSLPTVNRSAGAGTFAAARDVYILVTLVNGQGETSGSAIFSFVNTTLNDRFIVTSPVLAAWVAALAGGFAVTGYNVYEADVATGNAAPVLSAYKKVNGGAVAIAVNTNVDTTGTGAAPPTVSTAAIAAAGNICAGLRYAVVLFLNRNGYITGMSQAAVVSFTSPSSGKQLYMAHLPLGPSPNTVARIVAFTPAGQLSQAAGTGITSAGPYFWISPFPDGVFNLSSIPAGVSVADVVNGVSMTSTLVNDNTSTTATFNFTDDYLKGQLNDVSAYFRKIQVPNCSDVWYCESLRRMFYAVDAQPSGWYISNDSDPESVYGDTGLLQVAENNGEKRVAVREFEGVNYALKERSGHVITVSADDPSKWDVQQRWHGSGPCGFRAVDVCTSFMCYVHRSGVYIFSGQQPRLISKEIPVSWKSINWAYQHLISVTIDDENREIYICVPTGQSTVPNVVLKCNYEESPDFAPPIHFSPYIGKEIASGAAYKWSVDDIAAFQYVRAERPLVNPPVSMDLPTRQSQMLLASSNPDGEVPAIIPGMYTDNGAGIDWVYETACPDGSMKPLQLGGVQANVDGHGVIAVEVLAMQATDQAQPSGGATAANSGAVIPLKKPLQAGVMYACGARGQFERFRIRFSNHKQPDVWGDLKWCALFTRPVSGARPR